MTAGFQTRARTLWPGLQAIVGYALTDGQPYIIEGCHIEPEFARHLIDTYGGDNFRIGFLTKTDLAAITTSLQTAHQGHDWARERTTEPATFRLIAAWIQHYSTSIQAEADRHTFPTLPTDRDFEASITAALAYFTAPPAL